MTHEEIKAKIISNGVKNLKEFGYSQVDNDNIFTDEIYSDFFKASLIRNLGNGAQVDQAINSILSDIDKNNQLK